MKPTLLAAAALCAAISASAPVLAQDRPPAVTVSAPAPERARPMMLALGLRGSVLPTAGLDPFASNDVLVQLSVSVSQTIFRAGAVSLLGVGEWDMGSRSANARGQEASLTAHRLSLGIESRFRVAERLYLFAKAAPAAVALLASVQDPSNSERNLVARPWTWSLDTTGGAGLLIGGSRPGFWLVGEVGYSFAGEAQMRLAPSADSSDAQRFGNVMLPALHPAGPVARLALAISF